MMRPEPESKGMMMVTMRRSACALAALVLWLGGEAAAQPPAQRPLVAPPSEARPMQTRPMPSVAGKYAATFQAVANNCSGVGMSLRTATIELFQARDKDVQVTVPSVPIMRGVVSRAGKFKAEAKRGKTAIEGVDGRFSVAGRVDDKGIQFLFIAEYYRANKPMCTQSWNASGPRQ
jgi:hypothetical protein